MYLAPLNYDRYFKKVFSDLRIAKRFLEDFFDVVIEEIELLPSYNKITDNAAAVEFDFRCKINGFYVIIDMQQWYKSDIVKRFYMYHSMNTVLQLEQMPIKTIDLDEKRKRDVKDYDELIPVLTLIWMADDGLGFTEDFASYTMTHEAVSDFIRNKSVWRNDNILELVKERDRCMGIMEKKTKQLDFLAKNRLIYVFQKNIVANPKYSKYKPWFELAEKTRNRLNEKTDFDQFLKDDIFLEVIRRINKETLRKEDYDYIENHDDFMVKVKRYEKVFREEGREEGKEIGMEEGIGIGKEIGKEIGMEQERLAQEQKRRQEKTDMALQMKKDGLSNDKISAYTGLSEDEIEGL